MFWTTLEAVLLSRTPSINVDGHVAAGGCTHLKPKPCTVRLQEPKLDNARRIVAEWPALDEEARAFTAQV